MGARMRDVALGAVCATGLGGLERSSRLLGRGHVVEGGSGPVALSTVQACAVSMAPRAPGLEFFRGREEGCRHENED
jgi:hypothetical protein